MPKEFALFLEQVPAYLDSHPQGASLTELERAFGLERFEVIRGLKHLMNQGGVMKRGRNYFPRSQKT